MKFSNNEKDLSITMTFDSDEPVTPLAIATLIQKGENKKLWTVVVSERYRDLDCFDDFTEESRADGMVTLTKSIGLRKRDAA